MALASTSVLILEHAPPNVYHPCLFPQSEAPATFCLSRSLSEIKWV